jgi:ribulose-5-phosphate 4-epimerase/fuculose-1-phosphate aldolase
MKSENLEYAFQKMHAVGAALGRVNANNTHSGNLSMRDPEDDDVFYITAAGSQIGALVRSDIVPIRFSEVSWGDTRGSTESTNHRRIMSVSGANAVVHGHSINTTSISFDTRERQLFIKYLGTDEKGREEFLYHPVDFYGSHVVGGLRVGSYVQPVGSPEMEERLPKYLGENRLTLVRGHGPFARGESLEDGLYRLSAIEMSSTLLLNLRRRGVDVVSLLSRIHETGAEEFYGHRSALMKTSALDHRDIDDPSVIADFEQRLNYNYNTLLSAYGTGSMSQRITAREMIYCPMAAVPENMMFPLYRLSTEPDPEDTLDLQIHKLIYNNMNHNTCMITMNPMAASEGMATLAHQYGEEVLYGGKTDIPYTPEDHPVVTPIDAEAIYLNPRLGLIDFATALDTSPENPLLNMLRWYKGCCVVAGLGVVSSGETTLEQAAHNASSAERIGQFRSNVDINHRMLDGPPLEAFEPETL